MCRKWKFGLSAIPAIWLSISACFLSAGPVGVLPTTEHADDVPTPQDELVIPEAALAPTPPAPDAAETQQEARDSEEDTSASLWEANASDPTGPDPEVSDQSESSFIGVPETKPTRIPEPATVAMGALAASFILVIALRRKWG